MLCCDSDSENLEDCRQDSAPGRCSLVNMSSIGRPGSGLYEMLTTMIRANIEYFREVETETGSKILAHLNSMQELLHWVEDSAHRISSSAHLFDFDSETPANGFRSIITVVDRYIFLAAKLCRALQMKRGSPFFRGQSFAKELGDHVGILRGLKVGMSILEQMMEHTDKGSLFVDENMKFNDLFKEFDNFDPTSFYGRSMGFYFCDAIRRTLRKGHAVLSAYRDHYYQTGSNFGSTATLIWRFGKYSMDTELRAKQMVEMRKNVHTDFLKSMWSLNEQVLLKKVNKFISSSLQVCCDVVVPLERLGLPKVDEPSTLVEIPFPSAHGPPAPVRCRLLSSAVRDGMQSLLPSNLLNSSDVLPPSHGLILHFHGGGFIAQSAESHEIYLRDWARLVNVPILSVDYSLSPEHPYPRALEEVTFVYGWVLNNCHKLGWTGERICLAGDSAGGNLCLALSLRMIQLQLRRPDAMFCAYTPVMLNAHPSPSKVLTCMDPLIPLEFLLTCVHAYVGVESHDTRQDTRGTHGIHTAVEALSLVSGQEHETASETPYLKASVPSEGPRKEQLSPQHVDQPKSQNDLLQDCTDRASLPATNGIEVNAGEEHVIFEIPADLSASLRRKAAEMSKQSLEKVSAPASRRLPPKTRREALPWFHPENPSRLRILEALVARAEDPLMTPYLASDDLLRKMPPAFFLCLHLDPTLDDMIMFAKKLRALGCQITIKVLDYLPHGFLNLFPRGKEAQEGIQCCVNMLRAALHMETLGGK